nr:hypothetical protein [Euzebyales bacterium]
GLDSDVPRAEVRPESEPPAPSSGTDAADRGGPDDGREQSRGGATEDRTDRNDRNDHGESR